MQKNEISDNMNTVKLSVALLLLVGSVVLFYVYSGQPVLFRVGGLLVGIFVSVGIALQTPNGRNVWAFFQDAQVEVRKVVWPTRKETVQTTLVIILVVIIIAAILWLLDILLGWTIGSLMGHGG